MKSADTTSPPFGPDTSSVDRILRNSVLNVATQVLYGAGQFAVVFVLARALGKEGLGAYYTILALVLSVQLIVEGGTSTVLTRRIAQAPDDWKECSGQAAGVFLAIGLASVVLFLAIGIARAWLSGESTALLDFTAAGAGCAAMQGQRFGSGVFRAFEQFRSENLCNLVQVALFATFVVALTLAGRTSLTDALLAFALSQILAAWLLLAQLRRRWPWPRPRLTIPILKDWLAEAVPLGLGDVVRKITWQIDTILLAALQPAGAVGLYSIASRPIQPINWMPRAILAAAFPALARMADEDRTAMSRAFATSVRLLWVISIPIAMLLFVVAEVFLAILGGPEYREAAGPMRVLCWIIVLSFLSLQLRFLFASVGRNRTFMRLAVVALAVQVVADLALIPMYNAYGACAGALIGQLIFTGGGLVLARRFGVQALEWWALARAALAGAAMGAILWMARDARAPVLALASVAALVVYFFLCMALGALRRAEAWRLWEALASISRLRGEHRGATRLR